MTEVQRAEPLSAAGEPRATPRLSQFIRDNVESILVEWETFARSLRNGGDDMDEKALRDHAKEMLLVIAADLDRPQSGRAQDEKAPGERDADDSGAAGPMTAAQEHGSGRAGSGFTIGQMVAEFRALRASVTRLWLAAAAGAAHTDLSDLIRFNEAIDQAIAESVSRFSQAVARTQERSSRSSVTICARRWAPSSPPRASCSTRGASRSRIELLSRARRAARGA